MFKKLKEAPGHWHSLGANDGVTTTEVSGVRVLKAGEKIEALVFSCPYTALAKVFVTLTYQPTKGPAVNLIDNMTLGQIGCYSQWNLGEDLVRLQLDAALSADAGDGATADAHRDNVVRYKLPIGRIFLREDDSLRLTLRIATALSSEPVNIYYTRPSSRYPQQQLLCWRRVTDGENTTVSGLVSAYIYRAGATYASNGAQTLTESSVFVRFRDPTGEETLVYPSRNLACYGTEAETEPSEVVHLVGAELLDVDAEIVEPSCTVEVDGDGTVDPNWDLVYCYAAQGLDDIVTVRSAQEAEHVAVEAAKVPPTFRHQGLAPSLGDVKAIAQTFALKAAPIAKRFGVMLGALRR